MGRSARFGADLNMEREGGAGVGWLVGWVGLDFGLDEVPSVGCRS